MSAIRIIRKFAELLDVSWGSIADGSILKRSGSNIVAATAGTDYASPGLPIGYKSGMTLANNSTDATNDIDISQGAWRSDDNTQDIVLASQLTKQLDVSWAVGNNQGGRDTGSVANGTWHVFAIKRTDTGVCDVLFSQSVSSPTMPTNYNKKRRIGSFYRTSGVNIGFYNIGDRFVLNSAAVDYDSTAARARALLTLSVPVGIILRPMLQCSQKQGTTGDAYQALDSGIGPTSQTLVTAATGAANDVSSSISEIVITNTSAQIYLTVVISAGTLTVGRIKTHGWIDERNV